MDRNWKAEATTGFVIRVSRIAMWHIAVNLAQAVVLTNTLTKLVCAFALT